LLIRRDPRDLSRVFVLDSQDDSYLAGWPAASGVLM
jgi:Mu transposase, C-terminal